jgi:glycosyltransferase involved in cell wall biosynthesis
LCWDRNSYFPRQETLSTGVRIVRIQNIRSNYGLGIRQLVHLPRFWISLQAYLGKLKPSIIHCHDFDTLPAGLFFGMINHLPVIYDAHEYYADLVKPRLHGVIGYLLYKLILWAEQKCAHRVQAVVTVDEILGDRYRKLNQNVIILGHYPEVSMAESTNQIFTEPKLTLIYTGRLSTDRGLLIYVDLIRRLRSEGIPANLILAGTFTPECEKSKFINYAKDIENYVDFKGWIDYNKLGEIYQTADIGLAIFSPEPRYIAATPVKLFEYMANGLPVIASNFPSISAIVTDAQCGALIDSIADSSELIKPIIEWWNNKVIPKSLGENGRQAILTKYNWETQSSQLLDLYSHLT